LAGVRRERTDGRGMQQVQWRLCGNVQLLSLINKLCSPDTPKPSYIGDA
jgi:hypothetical protein